MRPCNETNNCSEIISGKCVKWSGELSLNCVTVSDCPKPSLEDVILALEEKVCNIDTNIGELSGITTGCAVLPNPEPDLTKVNNHLQLIYDNLGLQKIEYNTNDFTITGNTCANRTLNIKKGEWVDITDDIIFYNGFTSTSIEYMIEPATNSVRLRGTVTRTSKIDLTTGSWDYSGSGNSLIVMDMPSIIKPSFPYLTLSPGFNTSYQFSQRAAVTQYYSLQWITSVFNAAGVARFSAYVPYGATQDGDYSNKTISIYLHNYSYSLQ